MVTELLKDIAIDPVRLCFFQSTSLVSGHHDAIDRLHQSLVGCMVRACW